MAVRWIAKSDTLILIMRLLFDQFLNILHASSLILGKLTHSGSFSQGGIFDRRDF
jgi:hypothetical protein